MGPFVDIVDFLERLSGAAALSFATGEKSTIVEPTVAGGDEVVDADAFNTPFSL